MAGEEEGGERLLRGAAMSFARRSDNDMAGGSGGPAPPPGRRRPAAARAPPRAAPGLAQAAEEGDALEFYQDLPAAESLLDALLCAQPLPPSWFVLVTDVVNSTEAIDRGKYRLVNSLGVASIVVVANAFTSHGIPFVFGGDGATLLLPRPAIALVAPALVELQRIAKKSFGLRLRAGAVPARILPAILVGRVDQCALHKCPCKGPHVLVPVLEGEGLAMAEALVKGSETDFSVGPAGEVDGAGEVSLGRASCPEDSQGLHGLTDGTSASTSDASVGSPPTASQRERNFTQRQACFDGFNCRWREFENRQPPRHAPERQQEGFLALLVMPRETDRFRRIETYRDVLRFINGAAQTGSPIQSDQLRVDVDPRTAGRVEATLQAHARGGLYAGLLRVKVLLYSCVARWLLGPCIPVVAPPCPCLKEPGGVYKNSEYKKTATYHTDFLKIDGALRTVVAVTAQERCEILRHLEKLHGEGVLDYGAHFDEKAQITCFVKDFRRNHMHFIDVCGGGYTSASKQLKAQLRELRA